MRALPILLSGVLFAAPAASQLLPAAPDGHTMTVRPLPAGAGPVVVIGGGAAVAYVDGSRVVIDDGGGVRPLMSLQGTVFPSFLVQVAPDALLFGESFNGDVWLVPLDGSGARLLATVTFNFAAAPFGPGRALISAKTTGFATPDNDILLLDLQTGAVDTLAVVPGASGPVAVDNNGDVYYATSSLLFPAPPGSVDVLRFSAAGLQSAIGPGHLTLADATVVFRGIDSAFAMTMDGDGDLFLVDGVNADVLELSDANGPSPRLDVFLDYDASTVPPGSVQFVPSATAAPGAVFEPFQPPLSGSLVVHDSTFGVPTSRLRAVSPARAVTVVRRTPGGGPFSITTFGAAPGAIGVLAVGAPSANEVAVVLPGVEQPLFWAFAGTAVLGLAQVSFDAQGVGVLSGVLGGGGAPVALTAQVVFSGSTPSAPVVGSAAPIALVLP